MSHEFVPVQWNRQKLIYDGILILGIILCVGSFIGAGLIVKAADPVILVMRALGVCAILLLHIILAIGPLARLSDRFKPLLYNRRHFGVLTALVALAHGGVATIWYHGSGVLNPLVSLLGGYGDYGRAIDFPFEGVGFVALLILLVMAATSHDFWLAWLKPPVWKALHMSVYGAYVLLIAHVALGTAQFDKGAGLLIAVSVGAVAISFLHIAAILFGRARDVKAKTRKRDWIRIGPAEVIPMNKAVTVTPKSGERIAVFRHARGVSALQGVCAHQNGPLGEGCIIDNLVTCPWHGFQFDPVTGAAPPPFDDKVPTHEVKLEEGEIFVRSKPDVLGTIREAIVVGGTS